MRPQSSSLAFVWDVPRYPKSFLFASGSVLIPYCTAGVFNGRGLSILFTSVVHFTRLDRHISLKIDAVIRPFRCRNHAGHPCWFRVVTSMRCASSFVIDKFVIRNSESSCTFSLTQPLQLSSLRLNAQSGCSRVTLNSRAFCCGC